MLTLVSQVSSASVLKNPAQRAPWCKRSFSEWLVRYCQDRHHYFLWWVSHLLFSNRYKMNVFSPAAAAWVMFSSSSSSVEPAEPLQRHLQTDAEDTPGGTSTFVYSPTWKKRCTQPWSDWGLHVFKWTVTEEEESAEEGEGEGREAAEVGRWDKLLGSFLTPRLVAVKAGSMNVWHG